MTVTSELHVYELGPAGKDYARGRLDAGRTLGCTLARRFETSEWRCVAWLPRNLPTERVERFRQGDTGAGMAARGALVSLVEQYLRSSRDALVILEDEVARRGDPVLEGLNSRMSYYGSEAYHILAPSDANEDAIEDALAASNTAHLFVAVFCRSADARVATACHVTDDAIEAWASSAEIVVVGAYDEESYVLCSVKDGGWPLP